MFTYFVQSFVLQHCMLQPLFNLTCMTAAKKYKDTEELYRTGVRSWVLAAVDELVCSDVSKAHAEPLNDANRRISTKAAATLALTTILQLTHLYLKFGAAKHASPSL